MPIQSKVLVQSVEDDIFLRISILTDQKEPIDEFTCTWKDFFDFSEKVLSIEGTTEKNIEKDDHLNPEKLENFLNAAFESKITSSVSITHSFFLLRLRQAEKIHFKRISELSIMEDKIARLESDNVALQHVVMDLISTVDSLKSRLVSIEKNGVAPPLEVNPYLEDANNSKDDIDGQSTQSSVIISDSDPCLKMYPRFEREMDEFVRMIQPREAQISFRQEAAMIMKSLIQKALKCNAFVISFSELKCFLPDDPIRLTVVLNHAALSTWHKILYDRLVILSEQHEIRSESSLMPLDQSEMMFKIRDVRLISEADTFKISGLMDNLPFEIVGNGRVDLTMLAFFEEVGALVGNDHLLKRSVLLIRAWWWYESNFEGEKSPREYLPDSALWLMTAALFNVYHRLIVDPVQALYLFLRIYGSFDGRKEVVTLYGLKRIPDNAPHCVIERDDREYLIPAKLFEKYYNVVNVSHDVNPSAATAVPPVQQWKADNSSLIILNPFTMETITLEKLSSRKVEKIQAIFKQGLSHLKQSFDDMPGKRNSLTNLVFPQTMRAMLSGTARRDTAASSRQGAMSIDYLEMMKSPRDVYYVEVSQIWHEILFCNFILQGIVSESALLSLCAEVLTERRILPVGEVGKIVSDIVASPFLSSQLKEKFGGLKKFLEKYPEIFVFSKDHPFNPHVVLKRFLSTEQLEMVEAGTSLQAIFKAANRQLQQLQQQQQQQHGGGNRHSNGNSYGEAVQVGKKALQNRHNNGNMNHHNGGNRYDVNNSHSSLFSAVMNGNTTNSEFSLSANASPFNLDLSWKQPTTSSSTTTTSTSWNPHAESFHGVASGNNSAIPRLRGVDESFSSRYHRTSAIDSFSAGLTSSASSSSSHSMFDAQPPQPSFGLFAGNNNNANSFLNSPQSHAYSRNQQQHQQQSGDSFFSYS